MVSSDAGDIQNGGRQSVPATGTAAGGQRAASGYDLFLVGITLFSLVNMVALLLPFSDDTHGVIVIVDLVISLFLLCDFASRFIRSPDRWRYFIREWGWLDLLGSLPFAWFRLARLFRVFRVARAVRAEGSVATERRIGQARGSSAVFGASLLTIITLEVIGIYVLRVERDATGATIVTSGDALWFGMETVTTIGYGDEIPVTTEGRIAAIVLMTLGVGLFSIVTGFLAVHFLNAADDAAETTADTTTADLQHELTQIRAEIAELRRVVSDDAAVAPAGRVEE